MSESPAPDASVAKLFENPSTPAGQAEGDAPAGASTRPERPKLDVGAFKAAMKKADLLGLSGNGQPPKAAPPPAADPDGDGDDEPDDDMAAATRVEPTPGKAAPADGAKPGTAAEGSPAVEEAPVVAPNPQVAAAWERVTTLETELRERETQLVERERRAQDMGRSFVDDPFAALRGIAVAHLGEDATEDDIKAEVADIVSDLSVKQGGIVLDPKDPLIERRRIDRELRHSRAERRALTRQGQEAEVLRREEAANTATITRLGQELAAPRKDKDGKELPALVNDFPYLAASEDPAKLIFAKIEQHHTKTGEILGRKGDGPFDIAVVARLCEADVREAALRVAKRYGTLLQSTTPTQTPTPKPAANQGDPPKRRSIAAKPADASNLETPERPTPPRPYSEEEHREDTLKNFRATMAASRSGGTS